MRRMPRTAEASACSGTGACAKRSRTETISRKMSLNQSSSIWCTTMNMTSSFESSASAAPMPVCKDRSDSTSM